MGEGKHAFEKTLHYHVLFHFSDIGISDSENELIWTIRNKSKYHSVSFESKSQSLVSSFG